MTIEYDLPAAEYHAWPALSASGAWTLASECPAMYWHTSPFNPDAAPPEHDGKMDIGTALHLAVLEPERLAERSRFVWGDDWRSKVARQARDEAYADGIVPLLRKEIVLVDALRQALLANKYVADLLDGARTEVSCFFDADGVPCKERIDILSRDGLVLGDLKASASASPQFFQRQAFNSGHFMRAIWYLDGWAAVSRKIASYWFVIVAREPPHIVTIAQMDQRAADWGHQMRRRALTLFRACRERGVWPPYCTAPATLSLPSWSEYRLADDEQDGRFDAEQIRRGLDFLKP